MMAVKEEDRPNLKKGELFKLQEYSNLAISLKFK